MAELQVNLELTIRDALEAVDDLDDRLVNLIDDFEDNFTKSFRQFGEDLEVNVDTSNAEEALQSLLDLLQPVTLDIATDTVEAIKEIDDLTQDIEGLAEAASPPININIEADSSALAEALAAIEDLQNVESINVDITADGGGIEEATEQIEDLSDSMEDVGEVSAATGAKVFGLQDAVGGLANVSQIAQGRASGLSGAMGMVGGPAGIAATAVAGVAAAIGVFYTEAKKVADANDRLNIVFGELKTNVMAININGLTGNLRDLATQAGSSGSALMAAAASTGQSAISSGFSAEKAAELSTQLAALSLRAVALNPSLGEAGAVQEKFNLMLGRGGPRLTKFGISLTASEINARALANTGKKLAKELTTMEKTSAGAQIALEKLGATGLKDDFAKGIEQGAVKMKSLKASIQENLADIGAPLVKPLQKLFTALAPFAEQIAKVLGDTLKNFMPFIKFMTEGLSELAPIFSRLAPFIQMVLSPLTLLSKLLGVNILKEFLGVIKDIAKEIKEFVKPLTDAIDAFDFGEAFEKAKYYVKNLDKLWEQIVIRVKEIAPKLLEAGKSALIALGQGITSAAPAVLAFFLDLPSKIIELIGDIASWAFPIGLDIITALFDGIVSYAPKVFQFFLELPLKILGFLGNVATLMFPKGVAFIEGILSGVVGKAVDLFTWFTLLPWNIVSAIGDVAVWTFNIGKQIVNGIIDGIKSAPGKIKDALLSVVKNAWESTKSWLGIGSPSKLFADTVGLPVSQGIAVGIGKGAPLTTKALLGLGSQLATTGSNFSVAAGSNLATMGSSRLEPYQVNSGGGSPVIGSMTVIGQDPVSTAAAVGRELAFQRRFQGGT